mgnify:CR=1 FL=1
MDDVELGYVVAVHGEHFVVRTQGGRAEIPIADVYTCTRGRTTVIFNSTSLARYLAPPA